MSDLKDRADRVQRLLEDPDIQQAFADVKAAIHRGFESTKVDDGETLIRWRQRLHVLDSVYANLKEAISEGKLEAWHEEKQKKVFNLWTR